MLIIFTLISALIISTQAKYCATANDDTLYIYPSTNNCSKFIVCYHNEEIEMSCLEASLFMFTDERVCLEPCIMEMTTAPNRIRGSKVPYDFSSDYLLFPAINAPSKTIICPSSGFTTAIIPQNCNEYIECNNGVGTRRRCKNGYEFSSIKHECVKDTKSDCIVNKKLKGFSKCDFEKDNSSTFIFPSDKCSDFTKCANLMAWTITCAKDTIFSKEKKSCEWEDEVACEE